MGHNPTTPQKLAGATILPPVDSPKLTCFNSVFCVKPAQPPELPPQHLSLSKGFNGN